MKAKEYLLKIEKNEKLINNKRDELFKLRCMAESTTIDSANESVQSSASGDKLGNLVSRIVDLENEIISDSIKAVQDMQERISVIEQIDDATEYDILYKHYVKHLSLQQVSEELNYSYKWIVKLHGTALKKIDEILKTRGQNSF